MAANLMKFALVILVLCTLVATEANVKIYVGMHQRNVGEAERLLVEEIANPQSDNYGKFWSPEQIAQLMGASDEDLQQISDALIQYEATDIVIHPNKDWIEAKVPWSAAEALQKQVPAEWKSSVQFIHAALPIFKKQNWIEETTSDQRSLTLTEAKQPTIYTQKMSFGAGVTLYVVPHVERTNTVKTVIVDLLTQKTSRQFVYSTSSSSKMTCNYCDRLNKVPKLSSFNHEDSFCSTIDPLHSVVCTIEDAEWRNHVRVTGQESELVTVTVRVEYSNGVQSDISDASEPFILAADGSKWDPNSQKSEYKQSTTLVATSGKTTQIVWGTGSYGYSTTDLSRFYQEWSLPTNTTYVVPLGEEGNAAGDNYVEATLDIQYLTGIAGQMQSACVNTDNSTNAEGSTGFGSALLAFSLNITASSSPPNIISMSLGSLSYESCNIMCTQVEAQGVATYAQCQTYVQSQFQVCMYTSADQVNRISTEFMKMGMMGVTLFGASGDGGNHFSFGAFKPVGKDAAIARALNTISCSYTLPTFPAASPWVTAVGATQMEAKTGGYYPVGCSTKTGGGITGGCAFSWQFPMPSYQQSVVNAYLQAHSSTNFGNFNASGRAYPDLTGIGSNIPIVCNGANMIVEGTSCSTPAVAGLFSIINDQRALKNLPALGFINVRLYAAAATQAASMFVDVTEGNSACGIGKCCATGFVAAPGWDVFTGFGNPLYPGLLAAFSS